MEASLKKNILTGIAITAGLLLLAALGVYLYFIMQFSEYHDDQYKFSIKYPSSWRMVVQPQAQVAVAFLRPKDTSLDTVQENFNVTVQPLPPDIDNVTAFSARIKMQMNAVFEKNITIVEDKPLSWGWREGHIMVYEAPQPDHLKTVIAWVLVNDQAYIMTFLGDMNKYQQDSLFVMEMIRSLQLP